MGNNMNYADPQQLWDDFQGYAIETKKNYIMVHDFVGKDAEEVWRKKERPLTLEGFKTYVWKVRDFGINDYFYSNDDRYLPFSIVCTRIREAITADQIDGGMAGIYNPSITQRLNNLTEKTEVVKSKGKLPKWMKQK